jgi:hypothetical protein
LKGWHPDDNGVPSQQAGVQGRNSYAIKIRTQQQKQEQFAFSEFEVQSEFARNAQGINARFELKPGKLFARQIRQRNQQVQSDIRAVEPFGEEREEQSQCNFTAYVI